MRENDMFEVKNKKNARTCENWRFRLYGEILA